VRIAIVGTGISGLVAAHHLHRRHEVTVFEAGDHVGGHTNTVTVDLPDGRHAVDTGFVVCNERTYPHFLGLLDELGVATQPSDMSFSVSAGDIEFRTSNLASLYAQPRNIVRPQFQRMLVDVLRANRALRAVARGEGQPDETLREFVARHGYSQAFVDLFLVPFGASIWSADPTTFLDYPVASYARFMANHGLIELGRRPTWRTVTGGAATYVAALTAPFADRIRLGTPVHKVVRDRDALDRGAAGAIEILTDAGTERFDRIVLASHSDQTLRMLGDPSRAEREILGAIRYQPNVATLHRDATFLPRNRRARASWNFHVGAGDERMPTLTYWMNRLQSLPTSTPLLVTLNRHDEVDPDAVFRRIEYSHPVFDVAAVRAQARRDEIQGGLGTYFAGAYWGYGFHEDGVRSGLDVVAALERP
jgi:predicted NAD/FAD-binding protein